MKKIHPAFLFNIWAFYDTTYVSEQLLKKLGENETYFNQFLIN